MIKKKNLLPIILICISGISQDINITLLKSEISDSDALQIRKVYELERDYYFSVFEKFNKDVGVELYGDFEEYKHYQSLISKNSKSNSGFSSSLLDVAIIYKKKDYINVVNHELSHLILQESLPNCPKWLDEGLAEYFEYFQFDENHYQLRLQFHKIRRVAKWIKINKVKLSKFIKQSDETWIEKNKKPDFFSSSVSYCLVLFMQEKNILKQLLKSSMNEKSYKKIIENSYPKGFENFQTDFESHILLVDKLDEKILKFSN